MAALQLLAMEWRPRALPEGREAGIGQQRGCPTMRMIRGRPHPTSGSHLPPEGTAQPFVVASASLRLALHPKNCTLHPVQLPDLG
jgi:hypothetical protein